MKRIIATVALLASGVANAATFGSLNLINQGDFRTLSENMTAATHYKGVTPAEPLGVLGFDVGLGLSSTSIESTIFDAANNGDFDLGSIILPRLSVHKGFLFGLDAGASLSAAPGSDIKLLGAELRYAVMKGNIALPAIAVRASYSTLQGVDELEMESMGLELTASKGFVNLTPYGGVGYIKSTSTPDAASGLNEESYSQNKVFVGLNVNLGINMTFEADRTGDYNSYSAKVGFRF